MSSKSNISSLDVKYTDTNNSQLDDIYKCERITNMKLPKPYYVCTGFNTKAILLAYNKKTPNSKPIDVMYEDDIDQVENIESATKDVLKASKDLMSSIFKSIEFSYDEENKQDNKNKKQ
jgi:hypothetical protein